MNLVSFSKQAFKDNGGSFNLSNGIVNPIAGYMVSTLGNELKIHINPRLKDEHKVKELTQQVFKYIANTFDIWHNNLDMYLGVWYNSEDGLWYLDLSENITDLTEAIKLGKEKKQLAIWDCKNNGEIKL